MFTNTAFAPESCTVCTHSLDVIGCTCTVSTGTPCCLPQPDMNAHALNNAAPMRCARLTIMRRAVHEPAQRANCRSRFLAEARRLRVESPTGMHFNLVDILAFVYVVYGVIRGWRRGLPIELSKVTGAALAFVTGCGFYRGTERLLSNVSHMTGQTVGPLTFAGIVVATYVLVQKLKGRIRSWVESSLPSLELQKRLGAAAGAARTLIIASAVILFLGHLPLGFLNAPFKEGSLLGRVLSRVVLPIYEVSRHPTNQ